MPVTVSEASPAADGTPRYFWRATAGEGARAGWATSAPDAKRKGDAALRYLHAIEVHSPEELLAPTGDEASTRDGYVIMRAADGTIVEVPDATVDALLGAGYSIVVDQGTIPQRTNEHAGPVEVAEEPKRRGPGRPPKEA